MKTPVLPTSCLHSFFLLAVTGEQEVLRMPTERCGILELNSLVLAARLACSAGLKPNEADLKVRSTYGAIA